jgi:hypothetical protein
MRALTLTQPYAGLVASGLKRIENRPRSMLRPEHFGQLVAIHASREIDESVYDRVTAIDPALYFDDWKGKSKWYRLSRITKAVIAVAVVDSKIDITYPNPHSPDGHWRKWLTENLGDQERWFTGPIAYVLSGIQDLAEPVPCRGMQGFWTLPEDVEAAVRKQLPGQ